MYIQKRYEMSKTEDKSRMRDCVRPCTVAKGRIIASYEICRRV